MKEDRCGPPGKPPKPPPLPPNPLAKIELMLAEALTILKKPRPIELTVKCQCREEGASVQDIRDFAQPLLDELKMVAAKYPVTPGNKAAG